MSTLHRAYAWLLTHPVVVLDAVKALLAVGAVLGWWVAPATPVTDAGTAVAALVFALASLATHRHVGALTTLATQAADLALKVDALAAVQAPRYRTPRTPPAAKP